MLNKSISPEDYVSVKVNPFGRLIFYTRETLHNLVQYIEDNKTISYDTIRITMNEAKPHPVSVDLEDIFSEFPEGRMSQEVQKKYTEYIRQVIVDPKATDSIQFVYTIMSKINECVTRMFSAVRTVYVYHIGWHTKDDIDIATVRQSDDYIHTFLVILDNIYREFRPLDIIFSKIYWSFIFATPFMKQYYRMIQDIYWRIFGMERHITNDTPDRPDTRYKLYIKRNYYNADESATWNVGRGFIKPHVVLDSHEFLRLTNPDEYDSDSSQ